jgi:hypothetical protein
MVKAFFAVVLLCFLALLWVTVPRGIMRSCPVCQGTGYLQLEQPIYVASGTNWVEKTQMLCPFCEGGKISLYDLRLHRTQMLRWMVKEQKLSPEVLVKRVQDAFGQDGLDELHRSNFFMDNSTPSNN